MTTEENEYVGRRWETIAEAEMQPNGMWRVKNTASHYRSTDLIAWEEKHVSINVTDSNLDRAIMESYTTIAMYLEKIGYDLFNADKTDLTKDEDKELLN